MRTIKVLAICDSTRKGGNTEFYLNQAMEVLKESAIPTEVTVYSLRGKKISGCIACGKCWENGGSCILKDDFEELRQMWLEADCVIYALPVYVVGIPGQLKCFIDRLHNSLARYFQARSPRHMKTITCLAQGCELYGGQELAVMDIVKHAILINSLYVTPDGSSLAGCAWCGGMEKERLQNKKETFPLDYELAVKDARSAVTRAVELAAIISSGVSGLREVLQGDLRYAPRLDKE